MPATPTSHSRSTVTPASDAVSAASSATGMSEVPPVATTTCPGTFGHGWGKATMQRETLSYRASGRTTRTASASATVQRVASIGTPES